MPCRRGRTAKMVLVVAVTPAAYAFHWAFVGLQIGVVEQTRKVPLILPIHPHRTLRTPTLVQQAALSIAC